MALNVGEMLDESAPALAEQHEYPIQAQIWMETWIPQIVNEIEELRNRIVLQDTRITELEGDLEHMGG